MHKPQVLKCVSAIETIYIFLELREHTDYTKRLNLIASGLFETCYRRVARGMLHEDRVVFALLISRIYLKGLKQDNSIEEEFQHLLRGNQVKLLKSLNILN